MWWRAYYFFVLLFSIAALHQSAAKYRLKSVIGFPVCYRDPETIDDCLLKATEQAKPFLKKGMPKLRIHPFHRFFVSKVTLDHDGDGIMAKAVLKNMTIDGYDNYKFDNITFDFNTLEMFGEFEYGKLIIGTDYNASGNFYGIPSEGVGKCFLNISKTYVTMGEKFELVKRRNNTFLNLTDVNVDLKFDGVSIYLTGLFGNHPTLVEFTNNFINQNINDIFKAITPALSDMFSQFYRNFFDNFLKTAPYDVLFPLKNNTA